jgi:hypothetical protein
MPFLAKPRLRLAAILTLAAATGFAGGTAFAYQGHMWNALHALQNAEAQLEMATADKGGHRVNAINLINQAISEVQAGIAVGAM